jgi:tight adherence protein C
MSNLTCQLVCGLPLLAAAPNELLLGLRILVGLLICFAVAALVAGIFGQKGSIEMSPERRVALATGHADRHTFFDTGATQPLMWLLLALARRLPVRGLRKWLRTTLVAAGSPNFYTPDEVIAMSMLWGLTVGILLEAAGLLTGGGDRDAASVILTMILGLAAGSGGYLFSLHNKAANRIREIARRVPYTLDLIALAMGAGATFTEAIRTVIREDPNHPFNVELNTLLAEVDLGTTRALALVNLSARIPLETLRSIVAAITQAESLGTPLSGVLKEQADLMRLQRSVRAEKLAAAASVRILLPSLLILMSVVLAVFAPIIIRAIKGELF